MVRVIAGIAGALVAWFAIATVGDLLLRAAWGDYAQAVPTMAFTTPMLAARLLLGALSSIGAGVVLTSITKVTGAAAYVLGGLLLLLFVPIHLGLWDKFPAWYHMVFLISLVPLSVAGARLVPPRRAPS